MVALSNTIRLFALTGLIYGAWCVGQAPGKPLSFDAGTSSLAEPVQLPADVLQLVLRSSKDTLPPNLRCEKAEQDAEEPKPEILCSLIPLSADGENFIVLGVGSLRGAHTIEMWLLRKNKAGASLLFRSSADQFDIGPKRTNGFLEVQASHVLGGRITTDRYRFDGSRYVRYHH